MKTTRTLRISSYKDYIAVDIIDESKKVLSTPFYLKNGETKTLLAKDQEEGKWYNTAVKISDNFEILNCKSSDGLEFDGSFADLTNEYLYKFL